MPAQAGIQMEQDRDRLYRKFSSEECSALLLRGECGGGGRAALPPGLTSPGANCTKPARDTDPCVVFFSLMRGVEQPGSSRGS